jgi:hypothetical protein
MKKYPKIINSLAMVIVFLFICISQVSNINANVLKKSVADDTKMETNRIQQTGKSDDVFPEKDSYISMKSPDINYGSSEIMSVRNIHGNESEDWEMDTLIRFNISISNSEMFLGATLRLFYCFYEETDPFGRVISVHKITSDWNESTVTWNNKPNISSEISSSSTVPSSYGYMDWNVTDDVSYFIRYEYLNFGWQIMDELPWDNSDVPLASFTTRENISIKPVLEIYTTHPPCIPTQPIGETNGKTGVEYNYTTYSSDADPICYKWDWGDGNFSDWLSTNTASHNWEKGCYEIRVKAMDWYGAESWCWSESLAVKMPRSHDMPTAYAFEKIFQWFKSTLPFFHYILDFI